MTDSTYFGIGVLSRKTGCKVPTIRYYEDIGLMPEPSRTEGQQRRYNTKHLERLRFVLHGRELGFTLEDIRELLHLADDGGMQQHAAETIAVKHLQEVESKIKRLRSLQKELKSMLVQCNHQHPKAESMDMEKGVRKKDTRKVTPSGVSCRVIEVLSNHALCSGEH